MTMPAPPKPITTHSIQRAITTVRLAWASVDANAAKIDAARAAKNVMAWTADQVYLRDRVFAVPANIADYRVPMAVGTRTAIGRTKDIGEEPNSTGIKRVVESELMLVAAFPRWVPSTRL